MELLLLIYLININCIVVMCLVLGIFFNIEDMMMSKISNVFIIMKFIVVEI